MTSYLAAEATSVYALAAVTTAEGGSLLAFADDDGAVWLWDPATGQLASEPFTDHTGPVSALVAVPPPTV